MVQEDFERLHKFLLETDGHSEASDDMRQLVEHEWPELVDVEDYILQMAAAGNHRISVFTGPVFGEHDISYGQTRRGGPWLIPAAAQGFRARDGFGSSSFLVS
jgi:hypothetical protein